jgi:hypothetical protein
MSLKPYTMRSLTSYDHCPVCPRSVHHSVPGVQHLLSICLVFGTLVAWIGGEVRPIEVRRVPASVSIGMDEGYRVSHFREAIGMCTDDC